MAGLDKIVLTGPESSGKSWLAAELANHFSSTYIPEYARLFLEKKGPGYNYSLLFQMAGEHKAFQKILLEKATSPVFLDTDLINYQIWSKQVFGKTPKWIEAELKTETDHKYLIMYPDLPWEDDPLRENPLDRDHLFQLHLEKVKQLNRPFEIIRGLKKNRLKNGVKAVHKLLGY